MIRWMLGLVIVGLLVGCSAGVPSKRFSQQDCERQGGRWISALQQCEFEVGGGGAGD